MNYNQLYVQQLEEIINAGVKALPIPYEKGNSVRIKNIVVRKICTCVICGNHVSLHTFKRNI